MGKGEPTLKVQPSIPQNPLRPRPWPLWPLVLVQPHREWLRLGSGVPAVPRWMGTYVQPHLVDFGMPAHVLCRQNLAAPHLSSDQPLPTSPIPAAPGVGRQLGQASACGSPGHKRQAGDRSTEFFKALMEPAS